MSPTPVRKILILAANPRNTSRSRLDQEVRDIEEGLRRAQQRDQFTLEQRLAVRPRDVQRAMLDVNPQIVHFSGHGEGEEGLAFEDDSGNAQFVDGAALAGLFELFAEQIECIVLNGCYSEVQAKAIAQHIPYVIGMKQQIGDQATIEFAVGFYDALGAGRSIEFAYRLGCSAIRLAGIAEHLTPVLLKSERGKAAPQVEPLPTPSVSGVLGKLWNVPNLPPHFLPRQNDLDALKTKLLTTTDQTVVVTGTSQRVGVQGMGGIGKSVLAAAVAQDPAVREAFADGVIWLSVGQEPRLGELQAQLARALGSSSQALIDGAAYLGELLAEKACLLMLDDVWQMEHLKPFNLLGPRCRMLITTRDLALVRGLGAREHSVDLLSEPEALTLLSEWSGQAVETLPLAAHDVMRECGRLPLALAMVGASVRGKPNRWENLLHKLQTADLEKIRQAFPDYPYADLLKAIQVSVEALEPEEQARYFDFAVFPEDTLIPEAVLQTFWQPLGLDEYDAQDLLDRLVDRSLLRRDQQGRLSLHDLQRDYIRRQVDDLTESHQRLLSAYEQQYPAGWCSVAPDGYCFEHLAYHLIQTGRQQELYALLTDAPAWMEAKFAACTGDSAYVADLELAISSLVEPLTPTELVTLVQLHTARRIVHKRVSRYTDDDLKTLVWLGRAAEALSYARLRTNATDKFNGLLTISKVLRQQGQPNSNLLDEAYELAQAIKDDWRRAIALVQLAAALAQVGRADEATACFSQAQQMVQAIEDDFFGRQAVALSQLAAALAQAGYFDQAQQIAQGIGYDEYRVFALSQLAVALAQAGRTDEANTCFSQVQQLTPAIQDSLLGSRADTLSQLAAALTQAGYFDQAQQMVQAIEDEMYRVFSLSQLATALAQAGRTSEANTCFSQAQQTAQAIEHDEYRVFPLSQLATALAQAGRTDEATKYFDQAQQMAQAIEDDECQADTLNQLVAALAQAGHFDQAQQMAQAIEDDEYRVFPLSQLAAALAQAGRTDEAITCFNQAQQTAQAIKADGKQADALSQLAAALAQAGRTDEAITCFNQAQQMVQVIEDDLRRAIALSQLAIALAQAGRTDEAIACFSQAQQTAQAIEDDFWGNRADTLSQLAAAQAQAGYFDQAQQMAQAIEDDEYRVFALSQLAAAQAQAGRTDEATKYFDQAQQMAQAIEDDEHRVFALSQLAAAQAQAGQFSQAQRMAQAITADRGRAFVLRQLSTAMAQAGQFPQALTTLEFQDGSYFLAVLAEWAPAFEQREVGLSIVVLRAALAIWVWVQPQWQEVYRLFQQAGGEVA